MRVTKHAKQSWSYVPLRAMPIGRYKLKRDLCDNCSNEAEASNSTYCDDLKDWKDHGHGDGHCKCRDKDI